MQKAATCEATHAPTASKLPVFPTHATRATRPKFLATASLESPGRTTITREISRLELLGHQFLLRRQTVSERKPQNRLRAPTIGLQALSPFGALVAKKKSKTAKMITKFMTEVTTRFNPFSPTSKSARLFLSFIPPTARSSGMAIKTVLLPRTSTEPPSLFVKFKDGKEMKIDCEKMPIKSIIEEVDRHSRGLQKQSDLTD
ncbi:hypothetical protein LX36DRAFT_652486 [Colletotrichum falcatum]|nr:hypothetical protein LX36DRAFT_652486 [Colletotrichum falcatum]